MSPQQALARIAAHCDELETDAHPGRLIAQVRAVLAEVTPETGAQARLESARAMLEDLAQNLDGAQGDAFSAREDVLAVLAVLAGPLAAEETP